MAVETNSLDIGAALRGERIFVTGGTGFLGKVLVEKLLWSVPEVGKLLLLVRPDGERDAGERLREELLESPIMARLRALHAEDWPRWADEKIELVAGDLARDRFGLDAESWAALARRVDRVVGCAATVTFDERLDRALELNVRGAARTLELARAAGAAPLLHVSTCFVSGRRKGSIPERLAETGAGAADPADLDSTLAALDGACRRLGEGADGSALAAAGAEQAARHGFHDVYTLTKALAERLIARDRGEVPVAILRPAIVESALREPIPGWIDAVRVADPLLVAYGKGKTRELPGAPEARLEIVPVDLVVNALIAALAALPARREPPPDSSSVHPLRVYQVGSGRRPITLEELLAWAREGFARTPLRDDRGEPIPVPEARLVDPERYRRRLLARRRRARWLARRLGATRLGGRLASADRTLGHFLRLFEVYSPYLDHGARYEDAATRELWRSLSPADRASFPFDPDAVDWRSYVANVHVPGLLRFALRAESGAPPPPRRDDPLAAAHARGEFPAAGVSNLFDLLATAAAADPAAVAFQTCRRGRWLRYTYGQALTATANIAARLRRLGVEPGDRVALWGSASPEWVLTSFAVHRLGAVTVPLDPQWPAAEIAEASRFSGARLICAAPVLAPRLAELPAPRPRSGLGTGLGYSSGSAAGERPDDRLPVVELAEPFVPAPDVGLLPGAEGTGTRPGPDDLACILFTSGTTVAPKAVPLTHGNLLANVRALVPVMRSSRERLLSVLPIHHVFEFTVGLLVPLVGNGTISYLAELKPAEIGWMMGATRPTMLVAVPRLLELLHGGIRQSVEAGGPALGALFRVLFALSAATGGRFGHRLFAKVHRRFGGCLRRIATGGSALEAGLGRSFQLMGFAVAEGYGMTETSPVLTVNPWGAIRFGSVGRPLPGVEVDVRPTEGTANGAGRIRVRGANVMACYYRNPEASRAAFADGWLDTGDVGFFDADGYLHIAGRTKDVIVTGAGKNVYPEEVELRYRDLPGVEELVVLGLPGNGRGERVGAVVVPRRGATDGEIERIREALAARSATVPSYQQISRLEVWRGELPKTTTMKVKRGLLREAILAGERGDGPPAPEAKPTLPATAPAASGAPSGEAERWLIAALARLTRTRPEILRADDRLAELGVDSLTRVELLAEIEGRFALSIDDTAAGALHRVRDLFDLLAERPRGAAAPGRSGAGRRRLPHPPAA